MGFFLPSFWQKRILRFALSHIELLDTDSLDLDRLDIAIGRKSIVELRDVGLRLKKLPSLLQLPPHVTVHQANVSSLRLHVPADIYNSSIVLEIEGIRIKVAIGTGKAREETGPQSRDGKESDNVNEHSIPAKPARHLGDDRYSDIPSDGAFDGEGDPMIPTAANLAHSFLETEAREEKEQLKATISKTHGIEQSQLYESGELDSMEGLGDGFSVPGFIAGFITGVVNRIKAIVKDVCLEISMELDRSSPNRSDPSSNETILIRFTIDETEVGAVDGPVPSEFATKIPHSASTSPTRGRHISITGVKGSLISESSLFQSLAHYSNPPSPITTTNTHSYESRKFKRTKNSPALSDEASSSSETGLGLTESNFVASVNIPTASVIRTSQHDQTYSEDAAKNPSDDPGSSSSKSFRSLSSSLNSLADEQCGYHSVPSFSQTQNAGLDTDDEASLESRPRFKGPSEELRPAQGATSEVLQNSPAHGSLGERDNTQEFYLDNFQSHYLTDNLRFGIEAQRYSEACVQDSRHIVSQDSDIFEYRSPPEESFYQDATNRQDLTASRIFSHEEAESMYQSAVSRVQYPLSQTRKLPGEWAEEDPEAIKAQKSQLHSETSPTPTKLESSLETTRPGLGMSHEIHEEMQTSSKENMLPQPNSTIGTDIFKGSNSDEIPAPVVSTSPQSSLAKSPLVVKEFFTIDFVAINIPPTLDSAAGDGVSELSSTLDHESRDFQDRTGGFSKSYIGHSPPPGLHTAHQSRKTPYIETGSRNLPENDSGANTIVIKEVKVSTDISIIRLAMMMSMSWSRISQTPHSSRSTESEKQRVSQSIRIDLRSMRWDLVSSLDGGLLVSPASPEHNHDGESKANQEVLLSLQMQSITYSQEHRKDGFHIEATVGQFLFGYDDAPIVKFDPTLRMRDSIRDILSPVGQDIKLTITEMPNKPSEITVMTLPMHICLDLTRLDELFGWFGGLSTILELGSSVVSTATVIDPRSRSNIPSKTGRAVRFESPLEQPSRPSTNQLLTKISMRIGGIALDVLGKNVSVRFEGTALKAVRRSEGVGVRIDKLKVNGPGISAGLELIKLEYLQFPTEDDLGRLLALLSPSREQDDAEDDILLDTFLRQRRQGGILRVHVDGVKCSVAEQDELTKLLTMSEELKKLSTVAKYLPEDDRPGILTLAHIRKVDLTIMLNRSFGSLDVTSTGFEIGHVSFPSLFLLGVDWLGLKHGSRQLLDSVLPQGQPFSDNLADVSRQQPSVTARLIGDELEPTLKIKLWNVRVDYHVSTIMALLGLHETTNGEVIVQDLVQSVAALAIHRDSSQLAGDVSLRSNETSPSSRPLKFDIGLQECAVSLNPRTSSAQGLLVFTHAKLIGNFPKGTKPNIDATFEIKRLSILIVDDLSTIRSDITREHSNRALGPNGQRDLLETLQDMGFVSVSDISSANIKISVAAHEDNNERSIVVEVRDNLFVLETCADSTQTLQNIFSGLSPPMPPSKELKYRTEVVPVQDMLSTFTGDAYETEPTEEDDTDYRMHLSDDDFLDDDVPQNLEYVSNFYNPDTSGNDGSNSALGAVTSRPMIPSFNEDQGGQGSQPLRIDENHFSSESLSQKEAYHWNSNKNAYEDDVQLRIKQSPFILKLRDVHIIWNLFDGYDWQRTRDTISNAVAEVETKAAEKQARREKRKSLDEDDNESVIGDFLFNSIYIGVGVNQNPRELARQVNRNLDDLASEAESFATTTGTALSASPSRQGASRTRKRKLRLSRSSHHKMTFELTGVAADIVVLPPGSGETQSSVDLRVHDLNIFDHVPTSTWKKFATYMHEAGERESGMNMVHIKILNVKPDAQLAASEIVLKATILPLRLHVDQDALDFLTRFFEFRDDTIPSQPTPSEIPFIQRAEVDSVPIKLDFKPKRVDYGGLRSGRTTEFMNFIVLDSADMVLRHVIIYGISGFDKLGKTLNDIWMPDVKRNQLPGVLAGLAPVRSLVNVGSGVRDLVVIPMREYRKDGRVMRSIQKGALSFAKTTTTELTKLGAKLAIGTQTILQTTEEALVPKAETDRNLSESPPEEKPVISPYADPPVGVVQGLRGGYRHLERDLLLARDAIVAMPGEVMESGSAGRAAKAVLRTAPTVILRPALGVTKAVGQTLMGMTSALDKEEKRRLDDKYKRR